MLTVFVLLLGIFDLVFYSALGFGLVLHFGGEELAPQIIGLILAIYIAFKFYYIYWVSCTWSTNTQAFVLLMPVIVTIIGLIVYAYKNKK